MFDAISKTVLFKFSAVNRGPLSLMIWSGIPYLENTDVRMLTAFSTVVEIIVITSGHLEQVSTTMSHICSSMGLANQYEATSRAVVAFPMDED